MMIRSPKYKEAFLISKTDEGWRRDHLQYDSTLSCIYIKLRNYEKWCLTEKSLRFEIWYDLRGITKITPMKYPSMAGTVVCVAAHFPRAIPKQIFIESWYDKSLKLTFCLK